jgi:diadenosine tetraphosphate (Ap4A) HIT family hydrolase
MQTFRTKQTHDAYEAYKAEGNLQEGCRLCEKEPIKVFKNWKIIQNKFPYDQITAVHHMLVPIRHVTEEELTPDEVSELYDIKMNHLDEDYVYIMEALPRRKSIPSHFHLHLMVPKDLIEFSESN